MNSKMMQIVYIVSTLALVVGAALGLLGHWLADSLYLMGALGYGVYYLLYPTACKPLRERRLVRMNVFASILFVASALARFGLFDRYGQQLWVVLLALGLIFMVYAHLAPSWGMGERSHKP